MDLKEQIEASFGDGPAHDPIEWRVAAGRRAVRRRRQAGVIAAAAATAAIVGSTALLTSGPGLRSAPIAGDPSAGPTQGTSPTTVAPQCPVDSELPCQVTNMVAFSQDGVLVWSDEVTVLERIDNPALKGDAKKSVALEVRWREETYWLWMDWLTGGWGGTGAKAEEAGGTFAEWVDTTSRTWEGAEEAEVFEAPVFVEYDADCKPRLGDGVQVLERVENPLGLIPPEHSVGMAVEKDGEETWLLASCELHNGAKDPSVSYDRARKAFATLQQWLDDQVAMQTDAGQIQLVEMAPDGRLTAALEGVQLVRQQADVRVGESFAPASAPTAVAEVVWKGETWFVLVRDLGGRPEYFPTAGSVGGDSIAEFLEYARAQYASGEGLR